MNELYEGRTEACKNLESAYADILRDATKAWRKKQRAEVKARKTRQKRGIKDEEGLDGDNDQQKLVPPPTSEFLEELVPLNKRPTHRLGLLGLVGTKVDSISWYKVGAVSF